VDKAFAPVSGAQRIAAMDVLRGFALLGIFMVNMEWFSRPIQELGAGLQPGLHGLDHALAWGVHVFMAGKFWILFSLLFGMGFAVMMARAQAAARPFSGLYLRRIAVLLLFGLAHAWLLWVGDILRSYALAALLLLLARHWSARTQLWVGLAAYLGFALLLVLGTAVGDADRSAQLDAEDSVRAAAAAAEVYANADYMAVTMQRLRDFRYLLSFDLWMVPMAWLIFLIGAWFVRSGRIGDPFRQRRFYARLALGTLPIGLALALASARMGVSFPPGDLEGQALPAVVMLLAGLPLALGYLSLVMLAMAGSAARWLQWLAPVGRMALTNYLLQSLLCTLVFYGYGLALWGRLGYAAQLLLAATIFALQAAASHWWLARFRFGPMEWLWRWATYGQRPAMRAA
jgi:uncharacterized protein